MFYLYKVLNVNKYYIRFRLVYILTHIFIYHQLQEIVIKYSDEALEETKEECYPGSPCITSFFTPSIRISLINPQKERKKLCDVYISLTKTVSPSDIVSYIAKKCKHIKGISKFLHI